MSDGGSKLTGWISVFCDVPSCQRLSSQPVHSCYKRKECHRGAHAVGSEGVGWGGNKQRSDIVWYHEYRKGGDERIPIWILILEDGRGREARDGGIETLLLFPDVFEVLYWLYLLFTASTPNYSQQGGCVSVDKPACPTTPHGRGRIFTLILTPPLSDAGPHSEVIVRSPLVARNGQ